MASLGVTLPDGERRAASNPAPTPRAITSPRDKRMKGTFCDPVGTLLSPDEYRTHDFNQVRRMIKPCVPEIDVEIFIMISGIGVPGGCRDEARLRLLASPRRACLVSTARIVKNGGKPLNNYRIFIIVPELAEF
jgi:hypothetical protein